ncbi:g11379 [Coccomyxa elongata]
MSVTNADVVRLIREAATGQERDELLALAWDKPSLWDELDEKHSCTHVQMRAQLHREGFKRPMDNTGDIVAAAKRPRGSKVLFSPDATAFWQNLHKAPLETRKVKSQLGPDEELVELEVHTLKLADNTRFMGYSGGLSSILVPPHYTELWKEIEPLIQRLTNAA